MGDYEAEDESRADSVAKMGAALGNIRYELFSQIALLHIRWKSYRAFFAGSQGIIDLLNATAPSFFYDLERIMWEDVLLHLCRVTDPQETMKKGNLTIQRLAPLVSNLIVKKELEILIDTAIAKTAFARDWRNRRLAHTALPPMPGEVAKPLATASRQHVEEALAAIRAVMNRLESHYLGCPVLYEQVFEPLGGPASLLAILRGGLEARKQYFRNQGVTGI
jgi:hypothetical protein